MMLNRDDDNYLASCFVDNAVGKSMDLAAARTPRQRRPSFGIIPDTRDGFFDFVRKLESQSGALLVVVVYRILEFRIGCVEVSNLHLPR